MRSTRRVALVALVVATLASMTGATATAADGSSVTSEDLRAMLHRAQSDSSARRRLATVTEVVSADAARREARVILDGRRYKPRPPWRPLHGALAAVGRSVLRVLRPVGRLLARIFHPLRPVARALKAVLGDAWLFWLLAGATVALAFAISLRLGRRATRAGVAIMPAGGHRDRRESPSELERQADAAERAGAFDEAVRLRFRAGLLRLDGVGAISYSPALTAGYISRTLRSPTLRQLTATFDRVAYGSRGASAEDAGAARTGWPRVLSEVGGSR